MKTNTFIIPIIRDDLLGKCLETLYENTPNNFYVYVIDQTKNGIDKKIVDKYIHLHLRPHRNLGFSKACNTGIKLVETEYFTLLNDDVEFIGDWWGGIMGTFKRIEEATPDKPPVAVNPSTIKLPGWSIGQKDDFWVIPEKDKYTKKDWNFLVNKDHKIHDNFTIKVGTVIDGLTLWCTTFKTELYKKIGWLDERHYPGGGEDYDYNCLANMRGYRMVGTTDSWVLHHWGKSFKSIEDEKNKGLVDDKLRWNNNVEKWGKNFTEWGIKCPKCDNKMVTDDGKIAICPDHPDETYKLPIQTKVKL
jgi:GT2 family glycosyltransferase